MRLILFVFSLAAMLVVFQTEAFSGEQENGLQLAQQDIIQCMEQCIRTYGKDSTTVDCKSKCASHITSKRGPPKDCGKIYKQCRISCGKDKACKKGCRDFRRNCV